MKQLLKARFLPPDYKQFLFLQYQRRSQEKKTVHKYTTEFLRIAERNNLMESDSQ